ncbi:ABC transporter ATP-binding protein [Paenibacillus athensensis]|uniref:ABC transporter ATP-binding protein n=1 Tax=Paenibacillus athensensis TaxID=1967502 RepID=A0A4Y8PXM1_9BACL|nr:ABC transporter ATP-binding protein [Paenibacillus athensensis]MCD1261432.1 ABC transporter ATP-binding protein [Paenibacillus athensensis]
MTRRLLEIEHVSKTIKRTTLLQPCSLSAGPGEIIALCGGNGAGKSTLLRMIAGISQPSQGTIRIAGLTWAEQRVQYADSIGYMPDEFEFGSVLTAEEALRFYAALRRVPEARVALLLEKVGLQDVRGRKVSTFSKGMRQRLLFAQALLAEPALLLLDEPTNGLDPFWMDAFGQLIREAASSGQTVVFSTHQLNIAEAYADRALFMDAGIVRYEGAVRELSARYQASGGLYGAFQALVSGHGGR